MSSMSTTSAARSYGPMPQSDSPTRPVPVDPALFRPAVQSPVSEQPGARAGFQPAASPGAAYRTGIDHIRFWVGTGLAAAISAMTGLVGMLLIGGILQVRVPVKAGVYALIAAAIVIGASALYNLMLHVAPHPTTYYGALAAVIVSLAVLLPFTLSIELYSQITFAGLNLVVGLMTAFLVPMAVVSARR